MITSIKKLFTSFFAKVFVGIIILPFIFWGMGDVFRTGNQNVLLTINSEKVSTSEFANYLNRLNLDENQRRDLKKTNLLEEIVYQYIGKEIIALEVKDLGIVISDKSLRDYIINDKTFFKKEKFSRTKYEEFLLKSGLSAPAFEKNFSEQEKKRQLLSYLSSGAKISNFLVQKEFNKENQIKDISYLDLTKFYEKQLISEEEIQKVFNENHELFSKEVKSISFAELSPLTLTGQNEYNKKFFNEIDKIENQLIDEIDIQSLAKDYNLSLNNTGEVDIEKKDNSGKKFDSINEKLFKKVYSLNQTKVPKLYNIDNKFFVAEVTSAKKIKPNINEKNVKQSITNQIKIKNIFENNTRIAKEISLGTFNKSQMVKYAKEISIPINETRIESLKGNKVFNEDIVREIFKTEEKKINLITDRTLSKNFIVFVNKTEKKKLDKNSKTYEKYKLKAKLNLSNKIYKTYDESVNNKYKIDLNSKVLDRIKNSL